MLTNTSPTSPSSIGTWIESVGAGRNNRNHDTCWPSLVTSTGPITVSPRTISVADSPG